jgi:hypothetical protein
MLSSGFVPGNLQAPVAPNPPLSLTPRMTADLIDAFRAAPPLFQAILCNLDGIYIDPDATNSWGFRDPNTKRRYIGLAANLWGNGGNSSPLPYSAFENSVLAGVMAQVAAPWPPAVPGRVPPPPKYSSPGAFADTPAMTLLAVLAHEFGHILWFDKVKGNNPHYDPNAFCTDAGNNFFSGSWQGQVSQPLPFVTFALRSDTHASGTGSFDDLKTAINNRDWETAGYILNQFYSSVWPSLLGAVSPEEDFAEMVKLFVLTARNTNQGRPITSMPLNIWTDPTLGALPAYTPDVYAGASGVGNRIVLLRKLRCITNNS